MIGGSGNTMHKISITVSDETFHAGVAKLRASALLGPEDTILRMEDETVREAVIEVIAAMLSEPIAWLEARGIECAIGVTESLRRFVFEFEAAGDAALFRCAFDGIEIEDRPPGATVH